MKTLKQTILLIGFGLMQLQIMAQPLPPVSPEGNPVPVGWVMLLLIFSTIVLGIKELNKKNK